jgi:hypothetical protein
MYDGKLGEGSEEVCQILFSRGTCPRIEKPDQTLQEVPLA